MLSTLLNMIPVRNNWSIVNKTNYFNFIISSFSLIEEDKKKQFIGNIKMIIGLSFTRELKIYVYEKDDTNNILKYL